MKKILCLLLAITMLMGSLLVLGSCDKKDKEKDRDESEEKVALSAPQVPKGYVLYENDYIYFVYPEGWTKNDLNNGMAHLILDGSTGNNLTVIGEVYSDIYKDLTVDEFKEMIKSTADTQNLKLSNIKISQVKNAHGVEITKITYNVERAGVTAKQTIFVVPCGDRNYVVNVTISKNVTGLVDTVFNSLVPKK